MQHLAVIMDGNRRWARKRGLQPWAGHKQGAESIKTIISFCLERSIPFLSLYTFSIENFQRSQRECSYLFDLIAKEAQNQLAEFKQNGIRVRFIGDRTIFPDRVKPAIDDVEDQTKDLQTLNLNFLFCYGSRQEIIDGIRAVGEKIKDGVLSWQDISQEVFEKYLWTAGIPHPELIIRTGGAQRLSNFLLYQAAYSEFHFLDCLWPEITQEHLAGATEQFEDCQRNFGT